MLITLWISSIKQGYKSRKYLATITSVLLALGSTTVLNYASHLFIKKSKHAANENSEKVGKVPSLVEGCHGNK